MNNVIPKAARMLTVDALSVEIYESAEAVAIAASTTAHRILSDTLQQGTEASVIFATGRSQLQCLDHFTRHSPVQPIWPNITGFHLDEYLGIAANHPASFRYYLQKHLNQKVTLKQFHEIAGDGLLPLSVCEAYERELRSQPLDLCFLGIGNNGHLAFNDPDVADFNDDKWVKLVRLDEQNRQQQASSTAFPTLDSVPQYAFTLTLSAISAVEHNLCLAFGAGKAEVVRSLLTGPIEPSCPASILRCIPGAKLMIDEAAASLLP